MVSRGRQRTILKVERLTTADRGFGDGAPDDWELVRSERFELSTTTGREYLQGQQMQSEATHTGRCRWFDGAHSGMRLRTTSGRTWHVESVQNEDERSRWLVWNLKETNG